MAPQDESPARPSALSSYRHSCGQLNVGEAASGVLEEGNVDPVLSG